MTTIIIFASSLFIATSLVCIKALEIKSGNKSFILKLLGKLDSKFESIISKVKFRILQLIQTVRYIILVQVRTVSKSMFDRAHEKIMSEYRMRQSVMMGQRNITNKGSVSFYLKKITEEKSVGMKGKIE